MLADVRGVAGQRHPAERANGAAEQRPQIGFGEDRNVEGVGDPAVARLGADQVAVIEHFRAARLEVEHGAHVIDD